MGSARRGSRGSRSRNLPGRSLRRFWSAAVAKATQMHVNTRVEGRVSSRPDVLVLPLVLPLPGAWKRGIGGSPRSRAKPFLNSVGGEDHRLQPNRPTGRASDRTEKLGHRLVPICQAGHPPHPPKYVDRRLTTDAASKTDRALLWC